MYAALATIAIHGVWHGLHVALVFLLFISLWIGFYCAGVWAYTERRAELD
jgi:hypothetical protein